MNMSKTILQTSGNDIKLSFDIVKIDKANRTVTGVATADNLDSDNDLVDIEGSYEAFSAWRGNIREMHGPKAVGKRVSAVPVDICGDDGEMYKGIEVTAYISKGAEDTWQKCLDGTLAGFSIGGRILEKVKEFNKAANQTYTRIKKYVLGELSLVDSPANPLAMLTIVKSINGVAEMTDIVAENHSVFYCNEDEVSKLDDSTCSKCGKEMAEIGYIETMEDFNVETINKMIDEYDLKKVESTTSNTPNIQKSSVVLQHNKEYDKVTSMELTEEETSIFKKFIKFLVGEKEEVKESTTDSVQNKEVEVEEVTKSADAEAVAEGEVAKVEVEASVLGEILKSIDDIKKDIGRTVAGSGHSTMQVHGSTGTTPIGDSPTDQSGSAPTTFGPIIDLTNKVEVMANSLNEAVNKFESVAADLASRIEKLENTGAVKKSAVNDDDEVVEVVKKNAKVNQDEGWGNVFVPAGIIADLGYEE